MRRLVAVRRLAWVALWVTAGIGIATPAAAQSRLMTSIDTTLLTVGDRMTMEVRVSHPAGSSLEWPDSVSLSPMEILDAAAFPPTSGEGGLYSTLQLTMTAFELGELEIPSFDVEVRSEDGTVETLRTDRFGIEVVTVGRDETGDIRDIRGPLWISVGVIQVGFWLLFIILVVVVSTWWFRRRKARGDDGGHIDIGPPPRPAHEVALEAFAVLEASPMLERGQVKEYHIEVSDILRRYVEGHFQVHALEMTTWEVLSGLEGVGVGESTRGDFRGFLDQCDMVKFAKVRPSGDDSGKVLVLGRSIVEATKDWSAPEPEPEPEPEPDAATEGELPTEATPEVESEPEPAVAPDVGSETETVPLPEREAP